MNLILNQKNENIYKYPMECQLHRPVNVKSTRSDSQTILRFPAVTDGKYKNHKDGTLFCVKRWLKGNVFAFP